MPNDVSQEVVEKARTLNPEDALKACGETEGLDDIAQRWDESGAQMPDELPGYLTEAQWRECREWGGLGPEVDEVLRRTAGAISQSPALLRLSWHCYWRVYLCPEACPPRGWPEFTARLGDDAGVFYMLVGLGVIPLMRKWHAELGIPEEVTRETAGQARCYCDDMYRTGHNGLPGMYINQLGWMRHYTRERYFRLGRLEYWLAPYNWDELVFRHKTTGEVAAFAADGVRFSKDGRVFADETMYKDGEGWTALVERTDTHVSGHLLHPDGHGTPRRVSLPLGGWEPVLEKGVMTLQMHIPSGGRMTPEACAESILRASEFFPRHFPDDAPVAITCGSWIFSPCLEECLSAESNLVRFQRELFLVPSAASGSDGLWFVFLRQGLPDPKTWPRDTSVQRAILDWIAAGNFWGAGRMFFMLDDAPRFGQQVYRNAWPPSVVRGSE
ncbi:MAG TPA: hypothetical protein DGT21_16405 [Armatimonadetes bacterium]|nr:hypothetical protein [Armatimonadota bacterium]